MHVQITCQFLQCMYMLFQWVICGGVLVKFENITSPHYTPDDLVEDINTTFLGIKTLECSDIEIWKDNKRVVNTKNLLEFNSSIAHPFCMPLSSTHFKKNDDSPADGQSEE